MKGNGSLHRPPELRDRAFRMSGGRADKKDSTCSGKVSFPRVTRKEPSPQSRDSPIAFMTSLGSGLPVLHAEPEEQAKPAASSSVNNTSPSTPLNANDA